MYRAQKIKGDSSWVPIKKENGNYFLKIFLSLIKMKPTIPVILMVPPKYGFTQMVVGNPFWKYGKNFKHCKNWFFSNFLSIISSNDFWKAIVATLALGLQSKEGLAKVHAKNEA